MKIQDKYLKYLNEKESKIHPKAKEAGSWFAATPASDVVLAGAGAGTAYKVGKAAGQAGTTIAKDMLIHGAKGAAIGMAGYAGYRFVRGWFDKCQKSCGILNINTTKRQLSLLNCKKQSLEKQITLLKQKKVTPEKINNLQSQIKTINGKINQYKTYMEKKKGK